MKKKIPEAIKLWNWWNDKKKKRICLQRTVELKKSANTLAGNSEKAESV